MVVFAGDAPAIEVMTRRAAVPWVGALS